MKKLLTMIGAAASFCPVKAVSGKCRIRLADVTGSGRIAMFQGQELLAEFPVKTGAGEILSSKAVTLRTDVPVVFRTSGVWQGRLLDWQLVK